MGVHFEKFFWALLTAFTIVISSTFGYVAYKMDIIATSVVELNTKIAVVIQAGEIRGARIHDHEARIRELEQK